MIEQTYYINERPIQAQYDTGLAADEIEAIVGRFAAHSTRRGSLRGEIVIYVDGGVEIRHHFSKKKLWHSQEEQ